MVIVGVIAYHQQTEQVGKARNLIMMGINSFIFAGWSQTHMLGFPYSSEQL
jgi:hypothetical protein